MAKSRKVIINDDQREYGAIAATAFDEIIVREDKNLRGRAPGESAGNVVEGVRAARAQGARAIKADKHLEEMGAVRAALRRAAPGDLVVCCVDDAVGRLPRGDGGVRLGAGVDGVRRPGRAGGAGGLTDPARAYCVRTRRSPVRRSS